MSIQLDTLTFGMDAEIFLRTKTGEPFPVCGLVGGTKDLPRSLENIMGEAGYAVQEDNAALEFNVRVVQNGFELYDAIQKSLSVIKTLLPYSLEYDKEHASVIFDKAYLNIPQMNVFGCEPDFNAWAMEMNDRPQPPKEGFRSAAAHVHIGWKNPIDDDRINLIRWADIFVVLPELHKEKDDEHARRLMYGKAGAFRWKEYGCEHRVLGNKWIYSEPRFVSCIRGYLRAIAAVNAGIKIDEEDKLLVPEIINSATLDKSDEVVNKYHAAVKNDKKWCHMYQTLSELYG